MGSELYSAMTPPKQFTRLHAATIDPYFASAGGGPRFSSILPPTVGESGPLHLPRLRDRPSQFEPDNEVGFSAARCERSYSTRNAALACSSVLA